MFFCDNPHKNRALLQHWPKSGEPMPSIILWYLVGLFELLNQGIYAPFVTSMSHSISAQSRQTGLESVMTLAYVITSNTSLNWNSILIVAIQRYGDGCTQDMRDMFIHTYTQIPRPNTHAYVKKRACARKTGTKRLTIHTRNSQRQFTTTITPRFHSTHSQFHTTCSLCCQSPLTLKIKHSTFTPSIHNNDSHHFHTNCSQKKLDTTSQSFYTTCSHHLFTDPTHKACA